jgi:hypothetical protein
MKGEHWWHGRQARGQMKGEMCELFAPDEPSPLRAFHNTNLLHSEYVRDVILLPIP